MAAVGIADPVGVWRNKADEDGAVTSWYDAGVRLNPEQSVTAAKAEDVVVVKANAPKLPAMVGMVEPMPPPGFVWSTVELDASDSVSTTASNVEDAAASADAAMACTSQVTEGPMTVAQACAFFAANPAIDASEKKAFLAAQGVSEFVIAQSECTATGMEKTVAGHP